MPAGTTQFGDISLRQAVYAVETMLDHSKQFQVLNLFAEQKEMPKNKSETIQMERWIPFDVNTTPLMEGVRPTPHKMRSERVTFTLKQFGDSVEITDKVDDLHDMPVLTGASKLSGQQAAETLEQILYGKLKAGTSVFYGNGTARASVNSVVSKKLIRNTTRFLEKSLARQLTEMLGPSRNIGTVPIEACYVAFCHTDVAHDLRQIDGFVPTVAYGSRNRLHEREIGAIETIRFITSPALSPWTDAGGSATGSGDPVVSTTGTYADVYPIIIVGAGSYGNVPLKGANSIVPMVLNPNVPRGGDPLGQLGYVSWKTWNACGILNEVWMCRVEVAVTDLT